MPLSGYSYVMPFLAGGGMQRSAEAYAREGHTGNVVAFACIRKIATSAGSVEVQLQQKDSGDLVKMHPVIDLLARPNRVTSRSRFIEALITWRLTAGDSFVVRQPWSEGKPSKSKPLYLLEPFRISVDADGLGMPTANKYQHGTEELVFPVHLVSGACDMVQFTNVNPTDRCRGLSPMAPATLSIDTHTAAQKWNKALRDDAGRPSGALVVKQADGTTAALNEEQYQRHCHVNFGYS